MALKDFLGNKTLVETLQRQLKEDRLPHALLLAGPAGVGKATLAQFLAKSLNCLEAEDDFCDQCSSCRKITEGFHPDVKWFVPDGQFIKIDQMRELSREAFFRPFEGRRRVFILNPAEKMRAEAANSILKTIEEPPETTTIILVTDKPDDLLITIRSRAQLYQFAPLTLGQIEAIVSPEQWPSPEQRRLLARISNGTVGRARSTDLDVYQELRHEMIGFLQSCASDFKYHHVSKFVETVSSRKESEKARFEARIEVLYTLLRDLFLLKIDPDSDTITNVDIRSVLQRLSASFSIDQITASARRMDQMELGERRNLNRGLAMDSLAFLLGG